MKKRIGVVCLIVATALISVACSTVPVAYAPSTTFAVVANAPRVLVMPLEDLRPTEEKTGAGAGLFNKSTKDALFNEPVTTGITNALVAELRAHGVNAVTDGTAPFTLTGNIANYRAIIIPPRTSFIPYVSYVTWLWTNDRVSAGVKINLKLTNAAGQTLIDAPYQLSENTEEWVGLAGLSSSARRLDNNYLVKILQAGLKNVLGLAATDVAAKTK